MYSFAWSNSVYRFSLSSVLIAAFSWYYDELKLRKKVCFEFQFYFPYKYLYFIILFIYSQIFLILLVIHHHFLFCFRSLQFHSTIKTFVSSSLLLYIHDFHLYTRFRSLSLSFIHNNNILHIRYAQQGELICSVG